MVGGRYCRLGEASAWGRLEALVGAAASDVGVFVIVAEEVVVGAETAHLATCPNVSFAEDVAGRVNPSVLDSDHVLAVEGHILLD